MSETVDTIEKKEGGEKVGVGEFIKQTREELDKVSFPSREDVQGTTIIVVANVIFFAIFLFLVDHAWTYVIDGFTWLVNRLVGL